MGGDLADFVEKLPHKIVLHNIMSAQELEEKLTAMFAELGE